MDRNGNGKAKAEVKAWGIQDLEARQEHILMARVPPAEAGQKEMDRFQQEFTELFPELAEILESNRSRLNSLAQTVRLRRERARERSGKEALTLVGNSYR